MYKRVVNKHKDIFLALFPFLSLVIIFGFLAYRIDFNFKSAEVIGENTNASQISANYYNYSDVNLKQASKNGKAVLFFATNWCSTCTELDKELMNESKKLDEGITVLKLDYDNSTEFKNKYGVTVQHTLVQVDGDGNEITKWIGGDIENINNSVIE